MPDDKSGNCLILPEEQSILQDDKATYHFQTGLQICCVRPAFLSADKPESLCFVAVPFQCQSLASQALGLPVQGHGKAGKGGGRR